jgi:hypothetical protein
MIENKKEKSSMERAEAFLQHNLYLGYITKETTVTEILSFIQEIRVHEEVSE